MKWYYDFLKLKMLAPEGSGGGTDNGGEDPNGGTDTDTDEGGANDKTFTQAQVNSMIANEKRKNMTSFYKGLGFESEDAAKAFVEKYQKQEEQNKTDLEKEQAKTKQLEAEKQAEQEKATTLQYKFDAIAAGCDAKSADDVVTLAKSKMSDDKDFATALNEIKEQYPAMFNQPAGTGGTGSGGTSPRKKMTSQGTAGIGERLAKQFKENNAPKTNDYFK